jgi:hypothetical protein
MMYRRWREVRASGEEEGEDKANTVVRKDRREGDKGRDERRRAMMGEGERRGGERKRSDKKVWAKERKRI